MIRPSAVWPKMAGKTMTSRMLHSTLTPERINSFLTTISDIAVPCYWYYAERHRNSTLA